MTKTYDVIVVGAGPIGSYTASQLARRGFSVGLFERQKKVGAGTLCSGVISIQAFKRYELPYDSILTKITAFAFVSPSRQRLEYEQEDPLAYVINRDLFDRELFKLAKSRGVEAHLNARVTAIRESAQDCVVETGAKDYRARVVCIATGNDYRLQLGLGMGRPARMLHGHQIEIPLAIDVPSKVLIHMGANVAPGSFGWLIPTSLKSCRVGVLINQNNKKYLKNLIRERVGDIGDCEKNIRSKPIAYAGIKKTATARVIAVGEAAGQVKTTTGGGIFYGLLCSEIAVEEIGKVLKNTSANLLDYETIWRSTLVTEQEIGMKVRAIAGAIDDARLENMFSFVKKNSYWIKLLTPRINFDYHSNMLNFCLETFKYILKLRTR